MRHRLLLLVVAAGLLLPQSALALNVVFTQPTGNTTVFGMTTIEATASNGPAPYFFTVLVDGSLSAIAGQINGATATYTWDTALGDNGSHALQVTASDASGATAVATTRIFVNNPNVERLRLVSARDHIEGAMPRPQSVYADQDRIYLGTSVTTDPAQGRLYVLERNRATNFPVVEVLDFSHPVLAVRGDDTYLYVAVWDSLIVYRKTHPLTQVTTLVPSSPNGGGPTSIAIVRDRLYLGMSQARAAADDRHVYLAPLNHGDIAVEIFRDTWAIGRTFGGSFETDSLVVFDLATGARVGGIPYYRSPAGVVSFPSDLYVDDDVLSIPLPPGVSLYDPATLSLDENIFDLLQRASQTNATVRRDLPAAGGTTPRDPRRFRRSSCWN